MQAALTVTLICISLITNKVKHFLSTVVNWSFMFPSVKYLVMSVFTFLVGCLYFGNIEVFFAYSGQQSCLIKRIAGFPWWCSG